MGEPRGCGLGLAPLTPDPDAMAAQKIRWYIRAQLGVLLLPLGLCLVGEAITRRTLHLAALNQKLAAPGPWFWYGTLGLICVTAGVGLMVESGLLRGYPRNARPGPDNRA
ncbi:hypothetical protein BBFGKLBO_02796 [Synechococcus sp. CBW1107]|jgi:hypothetical protein|nr:hypothetical protein BBFGKLBO_02796 [Synechococcus sp. CBW1107]